MNKIIALFKRELMLSVSLLAAIVSLFITPPSVKLFSAIDWKTLAILFMLLTVLEGFKKESIFNPLLNMISKFGGMTLLTCFFVYGVFFTSMFVTNDVSLIIFVPLTIILFRAGNKEHYILPVLTFENIAAIRGSLLTPFGSPQNLFLFNQSGINAFDFVKMMFPLWAGSFLLLLIFILVLYRKNLREEISVNKDDVCTPWEDSHRLKRIVYLFLFALVIGTIVSRTSWWPYITIFTAIMLLTFDGKILLQTDYVLLLTFLCFFIFSSSICGNEKIAALLAESVTGHEYAWSILLSQLISNVPASIVLWPFITKETAAEGLYFYSGLKPLLYGLDSAGLCSIIGSLASVINLRIYSREYPGKAISFMKTFTWISLVFFGIVVIPQLLLL